ncbi:uncharacterized protein LOC116618725 isoform X2 [Nematostella vectensis]|uniref:uncharacterized protein LOC116618725 isoform X2 n=1 Tax=Nematostella vectensis TaxID=45351 RepID=UPI0020779219|nr:uncharacterized protein LOC116618725 isoform X2 [Nematostella vectensis]
MFYSYPGFTHPSSLEAPGTESVNSSIEELGGAQLVVNVYLLFVLIVLTIVFFNLSFEDHQQRAVARRHARQKTLRDNYRRNLAIWNASQTGLQTLSTTRAGFFSSWPRDAKRSPSDSALQVHALTRASRNQLVIHRSSSVQNFADLEYLGRTRGLDFRSRAEAISFLRSPHVRTFRVGPGQRWREVCPLCHQSIHELQDRVDVAQRPAITYQEKTDKKKIWRRRILLAGSGIVVAYGIYRILRYKGLWEVRRVATAQWLQANIPKINK